MSRNESPTRPVFGGLLPEQIAVLRTPLAQEDVKTREQAGKVFPYVPGVTVINKLNKIFGFDGWSTRNAHFDVIEKSLGKSSSGKDQFRTTVLCTLELVIRTPGGREFVRVGVGADEKASSNFIDTVDNAAASALTYAIRSAAISLGHQFGLAVMRAKLVDANNNPIDWRRLCVKEPTEYPDLILLSRLLDGQATKPDGRPFDPAEVERDRLTAQAASDDDGDAGDGGAGEDGTAAPAAQAPQHAAAPSQASGPAPAAESPASQARASGAAAAERSAPSQASPAPSQAPAQGQQPAAGADAQGSGASYEEKRAACLAEVLAMCREYGRTGGREAFQKMWTDTCASTGQEKLLPVELVKKADQGGPTDQTLIALRNALRVATGKAAA